MTLLEEYKVWDYIDRHKKECDLIVGSGEVYGHIGYFPTKDSAKVLAGSIKKVFPSIKFKLETKARNQEGFELYGDYYKFYKCEKGGKNRVNS